MASVLDLVHEQLGQGGLDAISRQLGIDPQTAQQAVAGAIPILTGAMANQAATPDGAAALHQTLDQHGSLLSEAAQMFGQGGSSGLGGGLLDILLGGRRGAAENGLAQATGLDAGRAGQLLMMLAPLLLNALARHRQQQGLSPGDLSGVIQAEHERAQSAAPSGILGALAGMLDTNHDGSVIDDVTRMGGGLLGGLFGKQ